MLGNVNVYIVHLDENGLGLLLTDAYSLDLTYRSLRQSSPPKKDKMR